MQILHHISTFNWAQMSEEASFYPGDNEAQVRLNRWQRSGQSAGSGKKQDEERQMQIWRKETGHKTELNREYKITNMKSNLVCEIHQSRTTTKVAKDGIYLANNRNKQKQGQ